MKFAFIAKLCASAIALGLALSACGGGDHDGQAAAPSPAATAQSNVPPATGTPAQPTNPATPTPTAPAPAFEPASPESVGFSSQGLQKAVGSMHYWVSVPGFPAGPPGIAMFVARHGKVVVNDVYGMNDREASKPLKPDAIYRIHSMTKPVTAVAMLQLYEQGKWSLDDPITKFLPELAGMKVYKGKDAQGNMLLVDAIRSATMRELMTHSAGFAYGMDDTTPVDTIYKSANMSNAPNLTSFVKTLAKLPLAYQPGEKWMYSLSVDLQGAIVERLTGKTLPQYLQDNIFGPLKMNDTAFNIPESKRSRLVKLYVASDDKKSIAPFAGQAPFDVMEKNLFIDPPPLPSGGGGLVSTMADYARFAQMLLSGGTLEGARILAPESVKLMMTNQLGDKAYQAYQVDHSGQGFGLNGSVVVDPSKSLKQGKGTYSWGGAAGTDFWVDPANDLISVSMIQVLIYSGYVQFATSATIYGALVDPTK